jgi:hypothetical protein
MNDESPARTSFVKYISLSFRLLPLKKKKKEKQETKKKRIEEKEKEGEPKLEY